MKQSGQYYWYHNDHLGTPQMMTTTTGAVVWSAKYNSFGKATVESSSTVVNQLRLPGQYEDAETGLHYNYHRYFNTEEGIYLEKDPIKISTIRIFMMHSVNRLSYKNPDFEYHLTNLLSSIILYYQSIKNPLLLNNYSYSLDSPLNWIDPFGLRIEWGDYALSNSNVRSGIEDLNQKIIDQGLNDNDFVLRVTGGDRYRDDDGNIRSSTNDEVIQNSSQTSPHLVERGARAVDLSVEGVTDEDFDRALEKTAFLPENTLRNYPDGHTHIALPNTVDCYTDYSD